VIVNFAGKHLSELCKAEYPLMVKYCLWILAELAVIAADIPEGSHLFSPFNFQSKSYNCNVLQKLLSQQFLE